MKKSPFLVTALLSVLSIFVTVTTGCPQGTKTTVEAGLSANVDPAHCQEVRGDAGEVPGQNVALDCASLSGTGTIRIVFPRSAWWDIKIASSDAGPADTGPGK